MTPSNKGKIIKSSESLTAVDAIATTLMMWKVEALADLVDFEKDQFNWGHCNDQGNKLYVHRYGKRVSVSIRFPHRYFSLPYGLCPDVLSRSVQFNQLSRSHSSKSSMRSKQTANGNSQVVG